MRTELQGQRWGVLLILRPFREQDEIGWLRCRMGAFLDSAYWDDVQRSKCRYHNPSLELVVEIDHQIVGVIDVEKEQAPGDLCFERSGSRAMIWTVAVLPEHRRKGIARALLDQAIAWCQDQGITHLEAWTRDDAWVRKWYEACGFLSFYSYWHVWLDREESRALVKAADPKLRVVSTFGHVVEGSPSALPIKPQRAHECVGYELEIPGRAT